MTSSYAKETRTLTFKLTEEIDQHTADQIRRKMDDEIERYIPRKVLLDCGDISFMDSSAIGLVLGRYKLAKMIGGNMKIVNVDRSMKRILDMSGVSRIIDINEKQKDDNILNQNNIKAQINNRIQIDNKKEMNA